MLTNTSMPPPECASAHDEAHRHLLETVLQASTKQASITTLLHVFQTLLSHCSLPSPSPPPLPQPLASESTASTPNPTGGHPTHPSTSGGCPPQKTNKYVHLEVPTRTLTQLLWHTPPHTPPPPTDAPLLALHRPIPRWSPFHDLRTESQITAFLNAETRPVAFMPIASCCNAVIMRATPSAVRAPIWRVVSQELKMKMQKWRKGQEDKLNELVRMARETKKSLEEKVITASPGGLGPVFGQGERG